MRHERATPTRDDSRGIRRKANSTSPATGKFRGLDGKDPRPRRNKKGQTAARTVGHAANRFLNCVFLPRLIESDIVTNATRNKCLERDFFQSLSQVATKYGITPDVFSYCGNLMNRIALVLHEFRNQLQAKTEDWRDVRFLYDNDTVFFAKETRMDLGFMLYYIPVDALYNMLQQHPQQPATQLLLSVASYLYIVADIPYYRQEGCYINHMYTMVREWEKNNEDNDGGDPEFLGELDLEEYIGDKVETEIKQTCHLFDFRTRVEEFKPQSEFETQCLKIAANALAIYEAYPKSTIYQKLLSRRRSADDDQDEPFIEFDQYVSFYGSANGAVTGSVMEVINGDLQECCFADEPVIYETFDGAVLEDNDFEFEKELFSLIEDFASLLYNHKTR